MSQFEDDRADYGVSWPLEFATLENTEITIRTHGSDRCYGERCTIHNRSDHHMRGWPQHWRSDRGIMERICEHGIGHPDPDEYKIISGIDAGFHGCDGCCSEGGQVVEVNGVEYVEQELDENTILVPVKKKKEKKKYIKLTQKQIDALFDMMAFVSPDIYTGTEQPQWFDRDSGYQAEFSDRATTAAKEVYDILTPLATRESVYDRLSSKYHKHYVLIHEKRKKPEKC